MLVWANLRGTDSHGIIRIPRYIDLINAKSINPAANIRIEKKDGAAVVLEADRAPSAVAMTMPMNEAMDAPARSMSACALRVTSRIPARSAISRSKPRSRASSASP